MQGCAAKTNSFRGDVSPPWLAKGPLKVLALGSETAAAYTSLGNTLRRLGRVTFASEHRLGSVDAVLAFVARGRFDLIVLPNPYGNPIRLESYRRFRTMGFPVLVFDRGGLPGSWFFDVGFNADSPTYSPLVWDVPLTRAEQEQVSRYTATLRSSDVALEYQGARVPQEELRRMLGLGPAQKVLFVPFQRADDTTIRYFSGALGNNDEFARVVVQIRDGLRQDGQDEWAVLCKKHPLERTRPSSNLQFVDDDVHIHDLLELCSAVCVVNSGAGLLAAVFDKPVYYFGDVYYGHPYLNRRVHSAVDVVHALKSAPVRFNGETRSRLVHHLLTRVYSFGEFETEVLKDAKGNLRRVTRKIEFTELRFPRDIRLKKSGLFGKRLLYITPVIPVPINRGSAQRTDQTLRALVALGAQVHLFVLNRQESTTTSEQIASRLRAHYPDIASVTVHGHPYTLRRSRGLRARLRHYRHAVELGWGYVTGKTYCLQNSWEWPHDLERAVRRLASPAPFDIVFVNYLKVTPHRLHTLGHLAVADLHDIQTHRIRNDVAPVWPEWVRERRLRRFEADEQRLLRQYDKVIAISEVEHRALIDAGLPRERLGLIPVTLDRRPLSPPKGVEHTADMLFVGSRSVANVTALHWFFEEVLPLILRRQPGATVLVVGKIGHSEEIARLLEGTTDVAKAVQLETYVPDIAAAYRRTRLAIAPLRHGTGMKVKVIEALAHATPVVGTSVAFEGIHIKSGEDAFCADSAEDFAEAVCRLIFDATLRARVACGALELFQREHEFSTCVERMSGLLCGRPSTAGSHTDQLTGWLSESFNASVTRSTR